MRTRVLVAVLAVLAVLAGGGAAVLVDVLGRRGDAPPAAAAPPATAGRGGGVAAVNAARPELPVSRLAPGEQPPQFVVVSFDGACRHDLFAHYQDLAAATGSRFTFFLSALCLLPEDRAEEYRPPHKAPGSSAVGFADRTLVAQRIADLRAAYLAGNEIGTHYLGHFCDARGVDTWTTADWTSELAQFGRFVDDWAFYNDDPDPAVGLPFNASAVRGGRTPCLAGDRAALLPALVAAGHVYDASDPGTLRWPEKVAGGRLWEFPLQRIEVVGYGRTQLSMDYNLLVAQNGGRTSASPERCARIRTSTYDSYMAALGAVRGGNRAPLFIGNHFNTWACGAYRDALTSFVADAHARFPDVRFVSFSDLVRWLDAQDPAVLAGLRGRGTQRY